MCGDTFRLLSASQGSQGLIQNSTVEMTALPLAAMRLGQNRAPRLKPVLPRQGKTCHRFKNTEQAGRFEKHWILLFLPPNNPE